MAHITKRVGSRGTTYRVRFVDPDGRERSRSFKRKALAEDFATSTAHHVRAGTYIDPRAGRVTVKAYLEAWRLQQAHHRPKTAANAKTRFSTMVYPYLGEMAIGSVQPSTVRTWQAKLLKDDYSASTIKSVRGTVAGAFKDAVRDRLIPSSPFVGVKAPELVVEKVVPPTIEQIRAGVKACSLDRYKALLWLIAGTGLRPSEAWGLTVDRIDLDKGTIRVDRQLTTRIGKLPVFGPPKTKAGDRTVPLPATTAAELKKHLRQFKPLPGIGHWVEGQDKLRDITHQGLVFVTAQGTPLTRTVWGKAWAPIAVAMQLPDGKGLHQLRHFYASALIAAGRSVKEVQERLGHASAQETLDTYSHLFEDSDEGTRAAIDGIFGAA